MRELAIARHTDRPRQKGARMYRYLDFQMSRPRLIAAPWLLSRSLSFSFANMLKSSFEDCDSLPKILQRVPRKC